MRGISALAPVSWFFLELLVIALHSSLVAYWTPSDLGDSSFSVISFCHFILSMGFSNKNIGVTCHSLLQWTTFCQNSSLWPIHLGCPCKACLIASLSYTSPFAMTRLWYPWRGQYIYIHTYMYNWITILYTRNGHNIVNQLYLNFLKFLKAKLYRWHINQDWVGLC